MAKPNNNLSKAAQERIKNYEAREAVVNDRKSVKAKDNRLSIAVVAASLLFAFGLQFAYFNFGPGTPTPTPTATNQGDVPSKSLSENREWSGSMKLNNTVLKFTLDGKAAPQAVAAFTSLVKNGFYENTSCHRLTTQGIFVLQCGSPKGDGSDGPGYSFGPLENVPADDIYREGVLAYARRGGDGYSMGSQFFIVYANSTIPRDGAGGYTVFGKVQSGLSEVQKIAVAGVKGGTTDGKPKLAARLTNLTVK